jgi:hypothetical protein
VPVPLLRVWDASREQCVDAINTQVGVLLLLLLLL